MSKLISKTFIRGFHTKDLQINTPLAYRYYDKLDFQQPSKNKESENNLFKCILNKNISGLYYLDLGSLSDLHSRMNITSNDYPLDKFGSYRIGKFGLSKDISGRLGHHKNKKNGYGRWCNSIQLKWIITLPEYNLSKAERILSKLMKADGLTFDYTDPYLKRHKELIINDSTKEDKLKKIFKQVSDLFSESDILREYETEMLKKDFEIRLKNEKEKTLRSQIKFLKMENEILKKNAK